jgi:hypothetical protein
MFKKLRQKQQSQVDARETHNLSQSDDPNVLKTDDPTQFVDPNAIQTEWSPTQTIYPFPTEPEPSIGLQFDDPVATKTEWELADSDETSPSVYELDKTDFNRIEFKTKSKWFGLCILLMGMIIVCAFIIRSGKISIVTRDIVLGSVGPILLIVGLFFYFGSAHIVFDKYKGVFWKGFKMAKWKKVEKSFKLNDIHALQLIDEWCQWEGSSFMIYQLNIILKDSSRFNVFEDRKRKKILEAANAISRFLGKPVWDAT